MFPLCGVHSRGGNVQVLSHTGRRQLFTTPVMRARWPRLGPDGNLGSQFAPDLSRAKQELVVEAVDPGGMVFLEELRALEQRVVQALHEALGHALPLAEFGDLAKPLVVQNHFRLSRRVVEWTGAKLPLVPVMNDLGEDLRGPGARALCDGDGVRVSFVLVPYHNTEKQLFGCASKLVSVVRVTSGRAAD
jgi:hypothetical protein